MGDIQPKINKSPITPSSLSETKKEVNTKIEENSKSTDEIKHRDKVLSIYNKYGSDKI